MTATNVYALPLPTVNGDSDAWGTKLNNGITYTDALLSAITTGGSSNAYTLTTGLSLAAYVSGMSFLIKASFGNTSTATINVDAIGTKALTKNGTTALASGDIVSGVIYRISYDGTQFQIVAALPGVWQPLDATLTAFAALTISATTYTKGTGADAFSQVAATQVITDGSGVPTTTTITAGTGLTGGGDLSTGRTLAVDKATTAQIQAATANKFIEAANAWTSGDAVALTDATTIAVDLNTGINFSVTLGGNRTLGAPSNEKSQSGVIAITQDATGSRTLAYNAVWKFAGGTAPVLTTTANAVDLLFYQRYASGKFYAALVKDVK